MGSEDDQNQIVESTKAIGGTGGPSTGTRSTDPEPTDVIDDPDIPMPITVERDIVEDPFDFAV